MKQLATTLLLASLLTAPISDAAAIHAPGAMQSPFVVVLVDLEDDIALLHLDVDGIGNTTIENATGRFGIELPDVPDGVHAWSLTIEYEDGTLEEHEGVVSVLDIAALVRLAVQGAQRAGNEAAKAAKEAATAAQQAVAAAEAAQMAVEANQLPIDVARTGDLASLVSNEEFAAYVETEALRRAQANEERQASRNEAQQAMDGLDESVGHLLLVVVLGAALVAWYVAQVRRNVPSELDRALLRAVAVRLEVTADAPEFIQALHDLDIEQRRSPGLLDRVMAALPKRRSIAEGGRV